MNCKKNVYIICVFSIALVFLGCDKVKRKGKGIWKKSVEKVLDKTQVFERYDHDKPDTKNNLAGFKKHVQIAITPDINNVYYFADELGADSKYQLSFNCNPITIKKIIKKHNLSDSTTNMTGFHYKLDWWQVDKIIKLDPYWKTDGNRNYWFLWYDKEEKKAFFLIFDT